MKMRAKMAGKPAARKIFVRSFLILRMKDAPHVFGLRKSAYNPGWISVTILLLTELFKEKSEVKPAGTPSIHNVFAR